MTMTPKQALVKDGFLPAGSENQRGRLSLAAIERCKTLAGQGVPIKGYEVTSSISTGPTLDAPVVKKVAVTNEKVIAEYTILYDEKAYFAKGPDRNYGMREVCNTCRVSLVQNMCAHPTILGNIPVVITRVRA